MSMASLLQPAPPGTTAHLPALIPSTLLSTMLDRGMYISGALAFLLWDIVLTIPAEVRMYRKRGFKWLITPAFLVARYAAPVCIGLYVNVVRSRSWTPARCFHLGRASVFLGAIITSAASMIFGVRTWAMWKRNPYIAGVVALLWSGQLAANMVICNWLRPQAVQLGVCTFVMPGHEVMWSYYTCNIIYDTIITLLAFASLILDPHGIPTTRSDSRGTLQKVQQRLLTDGLIYFIATLAVNLINALFFSRTWTYEDINGSLANAVTAICASRLVLLKLGGDFDLRAVFGGRTGSGSGSPTHSASGGGRLHTHETGLSTSATAGVPASFPASAGMSMPMQMGQTSFSRHVYPPAGLGDAGHGGGHGHGGMMDAAIPYTVETQVMRAPHDPQDPTGLASAGISGDGDPLKAHSVGDADADGDGDGDDVLVDHKTHLHDHDEEANLGL